MPKQKAVEMEQEEPVAEEVVAETVAVEDKPIKPSRYLIKTKNEEYAGKTFGITFSGGLGVVDPVTLPEKLGRSVEEIVAGFRDMNGYEVIPVE